VALVLADMCLMQEARRNTVMQLPIEISPYFCDPTMNGDISYNGALKVRLIYLYLSSSLDVDVGMYIFTSLSLSLALSLSRSLSLSLSLSLSVKCKGLAWWAAHGKREDAQLGLFPLY
jgi:hypothetical protein